METSSGEPTSNGFVKPPDFRREESGRGGAAVESNGHGLGMGLTLRLVQELEGHSDRVWSAVLEGGHTRTIRSCGWSPDGKLLATASFDATTAVWEVTGGEIENVATLEGHDNEVKSVAWNSSGTYLATCSRDKHVWIWDVQPGNEFECMSVLSGHTQDVKFVAWHPTKDILVSASYDNAIKVWAEDGDGDDWRCVQTLAEPGRGHCSTVWALAFDKDGDRLVSCSDDLTLMVWDTSADLADLSGSGQAQWVNGLIASGAADDCIRIFAENREDSSALPGESSFSMVAKKVKAHSTDVNCVQWHPTDPRILASAGDDGTIKIWEVIGDLSLVG
ncbi:hypothetical protein AXG93_2490s1330 [Marchantia polymorpha subsp. ruderalis]|uniref:Probable cytosolic iron-sulfur protein assembly protein CIAO1 homolog n=1 Tax=Marchantia polymorpha subsp. ruderalis TaxID=1480154 RepID=A0A176W798_MARPO|nr:hypothetical protein AXG93_2490s1330 [Marchantia polymorpha subsp. ruderalis]